jgi:drug/metabolite transporter (DMT)-like permease|tara:strand:- start:30769 stop:31614 length:846 start_codon:yes stop_codon:yes gene_type:complete
MNIKLISLICLTLFFFATSSVLARAALINNSIDPYSFTFFRLFFGALTLLVILFLKEKRLNLSLNKNWHTSFLLFLYAICFSFAYINLDAGLGALILFAMVQLTIIITALIKKESIDMTKALGISLAFIGLIYLLYPSKGFEVSLYHSILMMISGVAWGLYTIFGKRSSNATLNTTDNFTKSLIFVLIFFAFFVKNINISTYGISLAFISGGITSSIGYLLWYHLLPNMKIITSGVLQLLIPPLAIFLGVIFLNEEVTSTLIISTILILFGILISIYKKTK